ncbi:MAG: bile acid:sodium symporter [Pseudomonadota bacterium]
MGILLSVFLPLSLAIIMFSLGNGLGVADFQRVASRRFAFLVGAINQMLVLPIVAFVIAILFVLPGEIALGLMILASCPGGVTSNLLTKFAKGDVALSVSLTAVISLVSIVTIPILVATSASYFMGLDAPDINVTSLAIAMFLITALPVAAGMSLRHFAPDFSQRADRSLSLTATILFVVIIIGALAANWSVFLDNLPRLAPALVLLNVVLLSVGIISGRLLRLSGSEATAIAIESGTQNGTLGITVGSLIVEQAAGLPPFSLPSAVYGITMYLVTIPFVLWRRNIT